MAIHHLRLYITLISTSVLRDQLFSLHLVTVSKVPSKHCSESVDILEATITCVEDGRSFIRTAELDSREPDLGPCTFGARLSCRCLCVHLMTLDCLGGRQFLAQI